MSSSISGKVQTVKGIVDKESLGIVTSHSHLLLKMPPDRKEHIYWKPDPDISLPFYKKSLNEAKIFQKSGGNTLVEMSSIDWIRDPIGIYKISCETGLNIIVTTGFNRGIFFPKWVFKSSQKEIVEKLVSEINEGIEGTEVKAGVIKIGTEYNIITDIEIKVINSAIEAHKITGASISAHLTAGTMGMELVEYLLDNGVKAKSICLGHCDRNPDFGYWSSVARKGLYICIDQIGKIKYHTDETRINLIISLIKKGFEDQILLGMDYARMSDNTSYGGGPGLSFLLKTFIKRLKIYLKENNLDEKLIEKILITNPAEFFSFD